MKYYSVFTQSSNGGTKPKKPTATGNQKSESKPDKLSALEMNVMEMTNCKVRCSMICIGVSAKVYRFT